MIRADGSRTTIRRSALALAIAISGVCAPRGAGAQITYDGCTDFRGLAVVSVSQPQLQDVAMATVANGLPVIVYNQIVLSWLQPQTRLFFYLHECAHHALGQLRANPSLASEQAADCWAISYLVRAGVFDDADVSVVQGDLSKAGPGDWTHLPGPKRAVTLRACLGRDTDGGGGGGDGGGGGGGSDDGDGDGIDTFAGALRSIVAAAPRFDEIEGDKERTVDEWQLYTVTVALPGFRSCSLWDDEESRSVRCATTFFRTDAALDAAFARYKSRVAALFPAIEFDESTAGRSITSYEGATDDFTIEVVRSHSTRGGGVIRLRVGGVE